MPNRAIKVPANSISSIYATKNDINSLSAAVANELTEHEIKSTVHLDLMRRRTLKYTCQAQDTWEAELAKVNKKLDELTQQVAKLGAKENISADPSQTIPAPAPLKAEPPFDNIVDLVGSFDGHPLQLSKWTRKVDGLWYANRDAEYRKALLKALPNALTGKATMWFARLGLQFRQNKPWPIWKLSLAAFSGGVIDRKERDSGLTLPEFPESLNMIHSDDETEGDKGKKKGATGGGDDDDEAAFSLGHFMQFLNS